MLTSFTGLGKCNGISTDPTKSVDYRVAATTFSNLESDFLRSHAVPTFFIKKASFIVEREKTMALVEI